MKFRVHLINLIILEQEYALFCCVFQTVVQLFLRKTHEIFGRFIPLSYRSVYCPLSFDYNYNIGIALVSENIL